MMPRFALPLLAAAFALLLTGAVLWDSYGPDDPLARARVSASASAEAIGTLIFPKDKVVDVKITIDEADFRDMLDNAAAEELKPASVEYNGVKLDNVGIRTKGNSSLRSVVNSDSDRYSFKLSFDEYISNQTLMGLGKINLNNNFSDATFMREFLSYELAEEMGLPVPHYSYVNVYINGELWGFYLAIEQIGAAYLNEHFGTANGALYKAEFNGNGGDLLWRDDDIASYSGLVRKSDVSSDAALVAMLDELNNGENYAGVLDIEDALGYIALNAVTVNMDSYLGTNKQNYYLYENDGLFSILPWEYNLAFGGFGSSTEIWIDEPTQGALAERPLIAKLLEVDEYKEKYHEIIREMVDGYLADDAFAARVAEIAALISPYVQKDPRSFYTYEQYEAAASELVWFVSARVANVQDQLDGTIASSGDGNGNGGGMGPGGFGGGFGGGEGGGRRGAGAGREGDRSLPAGEPAAVPPLREDISPAADRSDGRQGGQVLLAEQAVPEQPGAAEEAPEGRAEPDDAEGLPAPGGQDGQGVATGQADGLPAPGGQDGQGGTAGQADGLPAPGGQDGQGRTAGQADGLPAPGGQDGQGGTAGQADGLPAPGGPEWQGGQLPAGEPGGFGGGMPGGGFGGGPGGGMGFGGGGPPGLPDAGGRAAGSADEAAATGVSLVVLLLAGLFVVLYKRKRL